MRTKALLAAAALILIAGAWRYHKLIFQDDEKRVREIIAEMARAAEAKDSPAMVRHFSSDYSDANGYNKFIIGQLISRNLAQVDELRANVKSVDVMVAGSRAWATVTVTAEAVKNGKVYFPFGSDANPETPRLTFAKTSTGEWLIIKIENVASGEF